MAHSFYAGQLAKMMVPDYAEDTQEEVYLATMLRRIGETAFWCMGEECKEELYKNEQKMRKYIRLRLEEMAGKRKPSLNEDKKSEKVKALDKMIAEQYKLFKKIT